MMVCHGLGVGLTQEQYPCGQIIVLGDSVYVCTYVLSPGCAVLRTQKLLGEDVFAQKLLGEDVFARRRKGMHTILS